MTISESTKQGYLFGIGVGLALTQIDILEEEVNKAHPWPSSDLEDDEYKKQEQKITLARANGKASKMHEFAKNADKYLSTL